MNNILILRLPFSIIRYFGLKFKINLKFFWIMFFALTLSLLVFYIVQTNAIIAEGYQAQSYQKKLNNLSLENEALKINLAQNNYLGNVEEKIRDFGFEKINQIHYIKIFEGQVVTK